MFARPTTARTRRAGLEDRVRVIHGDACETGLPDGRADFVWSEDAWCYVPAKAKLVAEAVRITRPGGMVAFTDWTLSEPLLPRCDHRTARLHPRPRTCREGGSDPGHRAPSGVGLIIDESTSPAQSCSPLRVVRPGLGGTSIFPFPLRALRNSRSKSASKSLDPRRPSLASTTRCSVSGSVTPVAWPLK